MALKQDINRDILITIITSKIPYDVLMQLELHKGSKVKWSVNGLRALFNQYICARERVDQLFNTETMIKKSPDSESVSVGYRKQIRQNDRWKTFAPCRFCKRWTDECTNYTTVEDTKESIKRSCFYA